MRIYLERIKKDMTMNLNELIDLYDIFVLTTEFSEEELQHLFYMIQVLINDYP